VRREEEKEPEEEPEKEEEEEDRLLYQLVSTLSPGSTIST
jgi:hypothetical protein